MTNKTSNLVATRISTVLKDKILATSTLMGGVQRFMYPQMEVIPQETVHSQSLLRL